MPKIPNISIAARPGTPAVYRRAFQRYGTIIGGVVAVDFVLMMGAVTHPHQWFGYALIGSIFLVAVMPTIVPQFIVSCMQYGAVATERDKRRELAAREKREIGATAPRARAQQSP